MTKPVVFHIVTGIADGHLCGWDHADPLDDPTWGGDVHVAAVRDFIDDPSYSWCPLCLDRYQTLGLQDAAPLIIRKFDAR